jgi:C4-dicarboxylate-specific signal transduction histidine kinase
MARKVHVPSGERLVREGDPPSFYVVLEGELQVLKKAGESEVLLATHKPVLLRRTALADGRQLLRVGAKLKAMCRVFRLAEEGFWRMMSLCPTVSREILKTMARRVQNLETISQGREKLVALGTMAAGLSHELNNPAAAGRRAAQELQKTFHGLKSRSCKLNKEQLSIEQSEWLVKMQAEVATTAKNAPQLDALEQSDREDAITAWLEDHDIENGWEIASTLASAGLSTQWLNEFATHLPAASLESVLLWVEASLSVDKLVGEIEESTGRISELVRAVKSYSYMDQAPLQQLDVHEGLESTLTMLGHKLRDNKIEVVRSYDRSCPQLLRMVVS